MSATLSQYIADAFSQSSLRKLGVAVSGGGDSIAMLHLLHQHARATQTPLYAATVDHGLRDEAAAEAAFVAQQCIALGVPHETLNWTGWDGNGNLQNAARTARYRLLAQWARTHGLDAVALGHTADDQAETFIMRLGRRAGVDGLSAMSSCFDREGMRWHRPLLQARRDDLRNYLRSGQIEWVEDPSNVDDRFARVRARNALGVLADLGVESDALADVARNLSAARDALNAYSSEAARKIVNLQAGSVAIRIDGLWNLPDEIQRRLMLRCLGWINGADYAPRSSAVAQVFAAIDNGQATTLQGCEFRIIGKTLWIYRELQALHSVEALVDTVWDQRWRLSSFGSDKPGKPGLVVRALGQNGLAQCLDWRETGLPRGVLLSSPAVWYGDELVAAPLAGCAQNWQAVLERGEDAFFAAHITH